MGMLAVNSHKLLNALFVVIFAGMLVYSSGAFAGDDDSADGGDDVDVCYSPVTK